MITNFKLFEKLGDTIVEPKIIRSFLSTGNSIIWINVNGKEYMVTLCLYDERGREIIASGKNDALLKIDFMVQEANSGRYIGDLTNDKDMLFVMANVMGTIRYWASLEEEPGFHNINLIGILISAKSETLGDRRRSNIYKYYIENNLKRLGVEIIGERDVTKILKRRYGNDSGLQIGTEYKITPITIGELYEKMK